MQSMNIFDRLSIAYKAFQNPTAMRTVNNDWSWKWGSNAGLDSNMDMTATEEGVAQAYTTNVAISSAMEVWQYWLDGKRWEIRDLKTDKVYVDSEMRIVPEGVPGYRFYNAIKFYRDYFKHSYFKSLAFSDKLYGESYVRRVANLAGSVTGLQWLNPLITEPQVIRGRIEYFRYAGDDGYCNYNPQEIAYRIARRDPDDDLRGQSPVLAAIDAANIEANTKRALRGYFRNGMILGGLISPSGDNVTLSPAQIAEREEKLQTRFRGVGNAFRFLLLPAKMEVETFPMPDIEKNYGIIQPLRNEILMALGVPPQLANDPSQVNYDNADDMKRSWWDTWALPYARDIETFHNTQILPYIEPDSTCYFAFDLSPFETEKPEVIAGDVSAGYIDMATAQEKRGYDVNPKLKGIYLINNVPMHEDIIQKVANTLPSQYALDYAQAAAADNVPSANADLASGLVKPLAPKTEEGEITTYYPTSFSFLVDLEKDEHEAHAHELAIAPFTPKHDNPRLELVAWQKAYKGGLKRAFEPIWLRGDIGDLLQQAIDTKEYEAIKAAFDNAFKTIDAAMRAIQATRLDFENDFDTLLSRARSEKMGRVQWASAMRAIIRRYGERAYVDGMADGGVEDPPNEDDRIQINDLYSSNSQYVTELGNVLYKGDSISDAQAENKAAIWFSKTIGPFYQAGLFSADANGLYEWDIDPAKANCITCLRLAGQRHRLKGWKANYMPQGDNLACGGFECGCRLRKARGKARGNY